MSACSTKLHLLCGLAGSGKSTLACQLAQETGAVVLSEDTWLSALYGSEMLSLADYVRCADRLRQVMGPHVAALLQADQTVVMDFPANTREARRWLRSLVGEAGVSAKLHFLDVPISICRDRVLARCQNGAHPFQLTSDQFDKLASHFEIPVASEGFDLVLHRGG